MHDESEKLINRLAPSANIRKNVCVLLFISFNYRFVVVIAVVVSKSSLIYSF